MSSLQNSMKELHAFKKFVDQCCLDFLAKNSRTSVSRFYIIKKCAQKWKEMDDQMRLSFFEGDLCAPDINPQFMEDVTEAKVDFKTEKEEVEDQLEFEPNGAKRVVKPKQIKSILKKEPFIKKGAEIRETNPAMAKPKGNIVTTRINGVVNKPKRPLSAYNFFFKENIGVLLNTRLEFERRTSNASKVLGQQWAAITPEERLKYELPAKKDHERYAAEMKEFKETGTFTPLGLDGLPLTPDQIALVKQRPSKRLSRSLSVGAAPRTRAKRTRKSALIGDQLKEDDSAMNLDLSG